MCILLIWRPRERTHTLGSLISERETVHKVTERKCTEEEGEEAKGKGKGEEREKREGADHSVCFIACQ